MTIAEAVLILVTLLPEKWTFIGPTRVQAEILMNHLIQHLFDSHRFYSQLAIDMPLERLKRERRKDRLTFRRGGEINVLTADVNNQKRIGALLGQGSANIILDESPLIPTKIFAMIVRMLADSSDNFLMQVGNAFGNNHFKQSLSDPKYHKLVVDCYQGLQESKNLPYNEGHLTQEIIDEAKGLPFFEQLWECKFPSIATTNEQGYTQIVSENDILEAFKRKKDTNGTPKLGIDVGRGGDWSVFTLRWPHYAKVIERNKSTDLMYQVSRIEHYWKEYQIKDFDIFIDDIGVGGGVSDRCLERDIPIVKVVAGGKAKEDRYKNIKAENYWHCGLWIKGNALEENKEWLIQCQEIRYTEDSEKKVKIEPKEEFKKRMGISPDDAESLMLTFTQTDPIPDIMII
jgi:hypothetical protein